ncbi:MAG: hypothetical protein IKS18_02185 [Lachnospiraceae bacterium]|nr:hypothetical protein [Lachnospiraceae bacterium]
MEPERVNRLDFRELAGRTEQIIKDIEEERRKSGVYHNFFSRDQYLMSAFRTYSKILKTAEGVAFLRDKPGYVEFQNSVKNMYLLAETEETLDDPKKLQAAVEKMQQDLGMKLTKKNPAPAQEPVQVQREGPGLNLQ